jgi:hypothetical protein
MRFPDDSIEQIYAVYFNEYPYKKGKSTEEIHKYLHVHVHLLTRTRNMRTAKGFDKKNLGWKLIDYIKCFPDDYQILDSGHYNKVKEMMEYLRRSLTNKK